MAAVSERPFAASGVVRAFLAVVVPSAASMLEALRADPDLQTLPVRWLAPEGLHLTLAFLGEASSRELAATWPALAQVAAQHHPSTLSLLQPEPFPDGRQPRLVVAPVQDTRGLLQAVQSGLVTALAEAGYDLEDHAFRPHVSLGRLRPPLLRGQAAAIAAALRARQWAGGGAFTAQSVALMRSDLFPDGARYTVLAEAPLGQPR